MTNLSWSFASIWNESLEQGRTERPYKARETIWAGEVGGAMLERYQKFFGVKPSKPYDVRSLRKFEAGNIWEWIVGIVLKRAGLLHSSQKWVKYQYPHCLSVTGKKDYEIGGKFDFEKAQAELHDLELPEFLDRTIDNVLAYFKEKYPDGLPVAPLEIKSVGSFMFERYWVLQTADPRHKMQLFHYLKADNQPEGHLVLISKDDCRMIEVGVLNPSPIENEYKKDIEQFSKYIFGKTTPPKEPEIVYQPETGRFSQNFKVAYSQYLTLNYGYKNQAEFDAKYKPQIAKWNRTLNRMVNGDNMTKLNLETIAEIKKTFPNLDEIVERDKKLKAEGLLEEVSEDNG